MKRPRATDETVPPGSGWQHKAPRTRLRSVSCHTLIVILAACVASCGGSDSPTAPSPGDPKEASRAAGLAYAEFADVVSSMQWLLLGVGAPPRAATVQDCFDVEVPGLTAAICIDPDERTLQASASGDFATRGVVYHLDLALEGTFDSEGGATFSWDLDHRGDDGTELLGSGRSSITIDPVSGDLSWADTGDADHVGECGPVVSLEWNTTAVLNSMAVTGRIVVSGSVSSGYDATMTVDLDGFAGTGAVVRGGSQAARITLDGDGTLHVEQSDGTVEVNPDGGC